MGGSCLHCTSRGPAGLHQKLLQPWEGAASISRRRAPLDVDTQTLPHETEGTSDESDLRRLLDARQYREAFEAIVDRYSDRVFRLAFSMTRNRARSEDLAQETFLRVWKALPSYDGRAALSTWIYAIARNLCYTELRRGAGRRSVSIDDPEAQPGLAGEAALASADRPAGMASDVSTLLSRLPERQRQAVTLFYLEQKSHEETAALLGVPVGTLKSLLHRAKAALAASSP